MQSLSNILIKIIDKIYIPFKNYISLQIFKYGICGGTNMVFDWFLYFITYNFIIGHNLVYINILDFNLCITPHIASFLIVFPITLFTGFWLNKYITFTQSSLKGTKQFLRYTSIVLLNFLINYFLMKLFVEIFNFYPTPSKIIITLITVIISFLGQKYYSFKK